MIIITLMFVINITLKANKRHKIALPNKIPLPHSY